MAKLRAPISSSDTVLPLLGFVKPSEFPKAGIVTIESETIKYSGSTDKELIGCTRGYAGTSAAAHATDLDVTLVAEDGGALGLDLSGSVFPKEYSSAEIKLSNGAYITVSGDTIVFHNSDDTKSYTITLV